jgi:hypothetical protein
MIVYMDRYKGIATSTNIFFVNLDSHILNHKTLGQLVHE